MNLIIKFRLNFLPPVRGAILQAETLKVYFNQGKKKNHLNLDGIILFY